MNIKGAISQFTVAILPLGDVSDWHISLTTYVLEREYKVKVTVLPVTKIPQQYSDIERGRYQGYKLLKFLFFLLPMDAQRLVGLVAGSLEDDKNELCLGCASSYYRVALCSTPSISQDESYEIKNNQDMLHYRVIVHEFGHTLGIEHCQHPRCVMNTGASSTALCDACHRWADRELKVMHGSPEERFSLAENLFLKDCLHEAISRYREAVSLAPNEPLYRHRLSLALNKSKQKREASQEMLLALELSGGDPESCYSLGLLSLTEDLKHAEDHFAKAIIKAKDTKMMQRLVGQAYREILHDVERASRHYKEYLRLGGNDPDIVEWLVSRSQMDPP